MARRRTPGPITPLALPRRAWVLLFGGTFDPPHRWHVKIAEVVRRKLCREGWVVFVPAAQSPLKARGPAASPADRVAMLRLATRGLERARIWTDEIDRARDHAGPSYTIDTVDRLRTLLGDASRCRLLVGADQFVDFHRWKDWKRLLRVSPPAVVLRRPVASKAALGRGLNRRAWRRLLGTALEAVVPAPVDPMSSTETRALLNRMHRTGRVPAKLRRMLDPMVLQYVRERGLYGGHPPVTGGPRPLRRARGRGPARPAGRPSARSGRRSGSRRGG